LNILAVCHGLYGNRIARHVMETNGKGWRVEVLPLPGRLPLVIDEPEEFIPPDLPLADLVLAMGESEEAVQLIPAIVRRCRARAAILPVDNSAWMSPGLRGQIQEELSNEGVVTVSPMTFCTLTETACGFGRDQTDYNDELIAEFAGSFGRPALEIQLDGDVISAVSVKRSSPCGSTRLVAQKLIGVRADEAVPRAGLHAHHYPCLASMSMEPGGETLMHISGHVVNEEVTLGLARARRK
jgi:hypothetical protein